MRIMTDLRGYQPEGVKYTFPDDDPYQEGNEVYYNMAEFLNDDEFHQIWEIVGKRIKDMQKLTEIKNSQLDYMIRWKRTNL